LTDPDRIEAFRDWFVEKKLTHHIGNITKQDAFEKELAEAFIKQEKIKYIKPIAMSHDYLSSVFEPYRKKCPQQPFHQYYELIYIALNPNETTLETDEETLKNFGKPYHATENMMLYQVDIDNNVENGKEYLLYGENFVQASYQLGISINCYLNKDYFFSPARAVYLLLDFEKCHLPSRNDSFGLGFDCQQGKTTWSEFHSGIFEYLQGNYFYTIEEDSDNFLNIILSSSFPIPEIDANAIFIQIEEVAN